MTWHDEPNPFMHLLAYAISVLHLLEDLEIWASTALIRIFRRSTQWLTQVLLMKM